MGTVSTNRSHFFFAMPVRTEVESEVRKFCGVNEDLLLIWFWF